MENPNVSITGRTLSHYQVLEKIGEGGMGVVYKARDIELGRLVALKVLLVKPLAGDEGRTRFLREARAASALNHPGIVTIYEIGHALDLDFIVMEIVDGPSLKKLLSERRLTLGEAVGYARQIAAALATAHAAGIVHRDVKPANILISHDGLVKVVDFGLAKILESSPSGEDPTITVGGQQAATKAGTILGTVAYMSPEQAEGKTVDDRSDVFSLGVVLYEMLAGCRPFRGDSDISTLAAILRDQPEPLRQKIKELPGEVERLSARALQKQSEKRCSAAEVERELAAWQRSTVAGPGTSLKHVVRTRKVAGVLVAVTVLASALAGLWLHRESKVRWAREKALPQVNRLAGEGKFNAAFDLLTEAEKILPSDSEVRRLWAEVSRDVSVDSVPTGADVYRKDVQDPETGWRFAGKTPLKKVRMPRGYYLWRLSGEGLQTINEVAPSNADIQVYQLFGKLPDHENMVLVPANKIIALGMGPLGNLPLATLPSFWIDRYEVTNRQFKEFVSKGSYQKRELWTHKFERDGGEAPWEEAMALFRDATGRPGPATWEAGAFPSGKEDFPVTGVSWYEAAAYCESQGKQLPTIPHWFRAADPRLVAYVVATGNFSSAGTTRVGTKGEVGPFGTEDMGGNAREWCFNSTGDGLSYVLGGSWRDPSYQFTAHWAVPPLDRSDVNGFRCMISSGPVSEAAMAARPRRQPAPRTEPPISDDAFRTVRSLYAYDKTDLASHVEATDDSHPDWKKVKVSFQAAYGGERVIAYLFLPKSQPPPFQAVIYYPGGGALSAPSSANLLEMTKLDFIIRGGRAALYPVYSGTYERKIPPATTALQARAAAIHRVQDLMRSVDFLESRSEILKDKIGYSGTSSGSAIAPLMLALEERLKAAVLLDGGLSGAPGRIPEIDPYVFAPRVKTPVLMLNGRQDFTFPVETAQIPLFRLFGTKEPDKKHLLFPGGHDAASLYRVQVVREALNWFDKYLGPVK